MSFRPPKVLTATETFKVPNSNIIVKFRFGLFRKMLDFFYNMRRLVLVARDKMK